MTTTPGPGPDQPANDVPAPQEATPQQQPVHQQPWSQQPPPPPPQQPYQQPQQQWPGQPQHPQQWTGQQPQWDGQQQAGYAQNPNSTAIPPNPFAGAHNPAQAQAQARPSQGIEIRAAQLAAFIGIILVLGGIILSGLIGGIILVIGAAGIIWGIVDAVQAIRREKAQR